MKKIIYLLAFMLLISAENGFTKSTNGYESLSDLYVKLSVEKSKLEGLIIDELLKLKQNDLKNEIAAIEKIQQNPYPSKEFENDFNKLFINSSKVKAQSKTVSEVIKKILKTKEFASLSFEEKAKKLSELMSLNAENGIKKIKNAKRIPCEANCNMGFAGGAARCGAVANHFLELAYPQEFAQSIFVVCFGHVLAMATYCMENCPPMG